MRLGDTLTRPVDGASLAAFRVLFGLLGFIASARFLAYGWVEQFYSPEFRFAYWGFEWLPHIDVPTLRLLFIALALLSILIAVGLFYRLASAAFFLIFTTIELLDLTYYLNHYVLLSLLSLLFVFLPLNRVYSLDARREGWRYNALPAWVLHLLRLQIACVYIFAALAKLGSDWLLHAQPLNIWMSARVDTPLIGPLLDRWWVALAMSWAGFLNDLLAPALILWPPTRMVAYAVVVVFHVFTGVFFNIGLFPFIMIALATILLGPSWPRRLLRRSPPDALRPPPQPRPRVQRAIFAAAGAYAAVQLLVPLRHHLYGGDVLWHEQGMRFAWKVMLREKNGSVTYRVQLPGEPHERIISPATLLTPYQEREMSGRPDMILQLAHHIGERFRAQGHEAVEVRVDALVSLNGRPPAPLIDPEADLMQVKDGLHRADWILPAPTTPPARLERRPLSEIRRD